MPAEERGHSFLSGSHMPAGCLRCTTGTILGGGCKEEDGTDYDVPMFVVGVLVDNGNNGKL